jgi:hypothetical protein
MSDLLKDFTNELYNVITENEINQEKLKEINNCMSAFQTWLFKRDDLPKEHVDFLIKLYKDVRSIIEDENFTSETEQTNVINKKRIEVIGTYVDVLKSNLYKCLQLEWVNELGYNFIEKFIDKTESVLDSKWIPDCKRTKDEEKE